MPGSGKIGDGSRCRGKAPVFQPRLFSPALTTVHNGSPSPTSHPRSVNTTTQLQPHFGQDFQTQNCHLCKTSLPVRRRTPVVSPVQPSCSFQLRLSEYHLGAFQEKTPCWQEPFPVRPHVQMNGRGQRRRLDS